jgi:hypothetical protein
MAGDSERWIIISQPSLCCAAPLTTTSSCPVPGLRRSSCRLRAVLYRRQHFMVHDACCVQIDVTCDGVTPASSRTVAVWGHRRCIRPFAANTCFACWALAAAAILRPIGPSSLLSRPPNRTLCGFHHQAYSCRDARDQPAERGVAASQRAASPVGIRCGRSQRGQVAVAHNSFAGVEAQQRRRRPELCRHQACPSSGLSLVL